MCFLWLAIHRGGPIVLRLRESQTRRARCLHEYGARAAVDPGAAHPGEIEAEILSDEALERVKTGLQSFFGRASLSQQELSTSPRLAKLDGEAEELRALVKRGRLPSVAAQAALQAIERERAELVFHASRDERRVYEEAMKVIPQSAALYRAAARDLNSTLRDPTERAEARALIAELLGRQVRIRQDGAAVFARLEIDEAVLLASAAKSLEIEHFQLGSGGVLWSNQNRGGVLFRGTGWRAAGRT